MDSRNSLPAKFSNEKWLKGLLKSEKERRGVPESSLVFVGMHNLAQFWWCGMYSVLKSRINELYFFAAYLSDRLTYAIATGQLDKIPRKQSCILEAGDNLTLKDIEKLHKKDILSIITSLTPSTELKDYELSKDKFIMGSEAEERFAEKYHTFRWNFPYSKYVIIGVPDGITNDFVYEFKSTSKIFFSTFIKPIALFQADLYGYFFNRKIKRVQIKVTENNLTETLVLPLDLQKVHETFENFELVENGYLPTAPVKWKCKNCELNSECPIYK